MKTRWRIYIKSYIKMEFQSFHRCIWTNVHSLNCRQTGLIITGQIPTVTAMREIDRTLKNTCSILYIYAVKQKYSSKKLNVSFLFGTSCFTFLSIDHHHRNWDVVIVLMVFHIVRSLVLNITASVVIIGLMMFCAFLSFVVEDIVVIYYYFCNRVITINIFNKYGIYEGLVCQILCRWYSL